MTQWQANPKGEGVLVGADEKFEWLLPWWWARYTEHNHHPVAFVDFGMSHFGKTFCHERGEVITVECKETFSSLPKKWEKWEALLGKHVWESRTSWVKKPFAFLATPFEKTLWLDLDCEVLRPLNELFALEGECHLAKDPERAQWKEERFHKGTVYNSGVVLYTHGTPLIAKWAEEVVRLGDDFCSDQHVLSALIHTGEFSINTLDEIYNWRIADGVNLDAAIIHWVGSWGKEFIRQHCGIIGQISQTTGSKAL